MKQKVFLLFAGLIVLVTFSLVPVCSQAQNVARGDNEYVPSAFDNPAKTFPIMRPDATTIKKWHERHRSQTRATIDERFNKRPQATASSATATGFTSASVLGNLTYNVAGNQGSCGNCYAWAAHRTIGVDLKRQTGVAKELSIQYFNSCDDGGSPCCGGFLTDVTDFYSSKKKAIPSSNSGASWKDGSQSSCSSSQSCSNISTSTNYPISSISATSITTSGAGQATAIANIKNIINQGKAVWFAYYLPTSSAWNSFNSFWSSSSESTLWNSDNYCGQTWSSYGGGGHAVTIVGYDDSNSSTSNHYWIVLNSWGTTSNRPKGLYRHKMYVNYNCTFYGLGADALMFQTPKVTWNVSSSSSSTSSTSTTSSSSSSSTSSSGGSLPDLIVSAVSNSATSITLFTRSFSVTETTKNQGSASAGASTTRFYLSSSTSKTGSSMLISGSRSVASLAAGSSSQGSTTVTVPSGTATGSYYLLACADDTAVVTETDGSNNCKASSSKITVYY